MPTKTYTLLQPLQVTDFYSRLPSSVKMNGRQVTLYVERDYVGQNVRIHRHRIPFFRRAIRITAPIHNDGFVHDGIINYPNTDWAREYVGQLKESMGVVEEPASVLRR